jgi:pyridoxal phosphate enzyme (YggS family)
VAGAHRHIDIAGNVAHVMERVAAAASRAGRRPEEIALVAVAKGVPADRIAPAIEAGITDLGENYVQEAARKIAQIGRQARWHFVGHLQTNKAKAAVDLFDCIQTVDSARLAQALDRRCRQAGRSMPVLVQVNSSGEAGKWGVEPDALPEFLEQWAGFECLCVRGLMTIGRLTGDVEASRPEFRLMASLFERVRDLGVPNVSMQWLSMGMTRDFEVAIEEGANLVRVGTAIFGPRAASDSDN